MLFRLHHDELLPQFLHGNDKQSPATSEENKLKLVPGFTAKYNITRLVDFETFQYVGNAIEREKQIKAWTRAKRIAIVESTNRSGMICRESGISRRHSGFRRESLEQRAVSAQAETQIPRCA